MMLVILTFMGLGLQKKARREWLLLPIEGSLLFVERERRERGFLERNLRWNLEWFNGR